MIDTFSSFYYDTVITAVPYNGYMNIDEGAGEIAIEIPVGSYTLTTLAQAINTNLLSQGTLDYLVSVDRNSRKFTISATSNFDLLINSGSNSDSSIWSLIGFDTGSDLIGTNSYTSVNAIGAEYCPQFKLQSYVPKEDFQQFNEASVNIAATGADIEVINFGRVKFIEMDIKAITSRSDIADGIVIKKNSTGLEDARAFMEYITTKREFEFIPDIDNPNSFERVLLDSAPGFQNGTGYKLKELFNQNLRDIYETGILRMRVIE